MGASVVKVLVAGLISFLLGSGSPSIPTSSAGSSTGPCTGAARGSWDHVVVIVMENHSFDQVSGHSPYLNRLARRCGLARRYYAIAHPSLPNYLAMTAGRPFSKWSSSDCPAGTGCSTDAKSLFAQVHDWKAYEEHMTSNCQTVNDPVNHYAVRHNPPPYYSKIARACAQRDVPLGASNGGLVDDLSDDALPKFAFITPDLRHDEHDAPISVGDKWLRRWVPKILNSDAYTSGHTAVFITYDEGETSSNRIYTVVIAPSIKRHTVVRSHFTHYSLLRTWEQMLGEKCLRRACKARSMRTAFRL